MRVIITLFCVAILFFAAINNQAFSQEESGKVYVKLTFVAQDALGNTDTIVFSIRESLEGVPEPENLYGVEPQGDLDMRIIQRNEVKFPPMIGFPDGRWLNCGGGVKSFSENKDLKESIHLSSSSKQMLERNFRDKFVVHINAKHYPVKISVIEWVIAEWVAWNDYTIGHGMFGIQCDSTAGEGLHDIKFNSPFVEYSASFDGIEEYTKMDINECDTTFYIISKDLPRTFCLFVDSSQKSDLLVVGLLYIKTVSVFDDITTSKLIHPNPSKEFIIMEKGKFGEIFSIINLDGRIIRTFTVEGYPYSVDIRDLQVGTYFLRSQDNKIVYKFIKGGE